MTDTEHNARLERMLARTALADARAFQELYQATAPQLFGIVLRILRRKDWAEDALQETFVRVWQQAGAYRAGRGTVLTWLGSIARYRAIDLLRRDRYAAHTDDGVDIIDRLADPKVREIEWSSLDGSRLKNCLEALTESQCRAIVMAYCEGYTHQELSKRLASPIGTVKSWIRRGLGSLKRCLEA